MPCLSVNVHVKTFIMTKTQSSDHDDQDDHEGDDDYIQPGLFIYEAPPTPTKPRLLLLLLLVYKLVLNFSVYSSLHPN